MKIQSTTAALAALVALAAFPTFANSPDKAFIEKAARGGLAEVEMGTVAQQRASSPEVKAFASRMVADHSKSNEELKAIARSKDVTLPSAPDGSEKRHGEKLKSLSGAEFDREYMKHMVVDHKKTLAEFEKQASGGKDPEVKAYAAKTVPTLREHLKLAQSAHDAVAKAR